MDADTGRIVASAPTGREADDGAQAGPLLDLLDRITGAPASFTGDGTGDGGYDRDGVHAEVAERHPAAAVIVPPRATAVPSDTATTAPTRRDRHLRVVAAHGRRGWRERSGCTGRSKAEATIARWERVIGDDLRSREDECRATEVDVAVQALDRMLGLGRPSYARAA